MNVEVIWQKESGIIADDHYGEIVEITAAESLLTLTTKNGFVACYNISAVLRVVKEANDGE